MKDVIVLECQQMCLAYNAKIGVPSCGIISTIGEWICPCQYCQFFDNRKQYYHAYKGRMSVFQMEHHDKFVVQFDSSIKCVECNCNLSFYNFSV